MIILELMIYFILLVIIFRNYLSSFIENNKIEKEKIQDNVIRLDKNQVNKIQSQCY